MLISIIVPVYNIEKYIERCVYSIIRQTYKDLEIILVDDGSTDSSGKICDHLSNNDSRIKVIHKKNGGLASARNAGLSISSGSYICFVDADDWISIEVIDFCFNIILKTDAEIVQYQIETTSVVKNKKQKLIKTKIFKGNDILIHFMKASTKSDLFYSVCRCIFKKQLFDSLLFPEGRINEDIIIKYKLLSRASVLAETNFIGYYYFQDQGSITTSPLRKRDFDLKIAAEGIAELTQNNQSKIVQKLGKVKRARTSLSLLCRAAYYGVSSDLDEAHVISELRKELKKNLNILIFSPLRISRKILTILFCFNYRFTKSLINFAKRVTKRV